MESGVLTVLHTSDFQCGKPFVPRAADALVRLAEEVQPDVVVAAGDLTQRAHRTGHADHHLPGGRNERVARVAEAGRDHCVDKLIARFRVVAGQDPDDRRMPLVAAPNVPAQD